MARRLKSMMDVRRYLASLINRTEAGDVDPSVAGRLGYLSNILIKTIEQGDLERRIEAIEKELGL